MRKFIIKTSIFFVICLSCFLYILSLADGYTDPFYIRFTTPKQENLIIGTSRAAQGLQPKVINKICNKNFYNYAFTVLHSPYGETYFKSIKNKLKKGTSSAIFILTVDPWSISSRTENSNDSLIFEENNLCLGNTSVTNMNPNFFYLYKNMRGNYFSILTKDKSNMFLHQDGWLEVNIDMDSLKTTTRTNSMLEDYKKNHLPNYKYSNERFIYLKKTIQYLNKFGDVYMVRLPIHQKMKTIEDELMPNFNDSIKSLIPLTKGYFDMTPFNENYTYTDGNHLYKSSGKEVSEKIATWITYKNVSKIN